MALWSAQITAEWDRPRRRKQKHDEVTIIIMINVSRHALTTKKLGNILEYTDGTQKISVAGVLGSRSRELLVWACIQS